MALIVGLTGRKQSGKDTVADRLVVDHEFVRIAFADKLKQLVARFLDIDEAFVFDERFKTTKFGQTSGREVLQRLGVAARETFGSNFWVQHALVGIKPQGRYVITDIRFWNELHYVIARGDYDEVIGREHDVRIIRLNRADRQGCHDFVPSSEGLCRYENCRLPEKSHPTHSSGDAHESETTLPDVHPSYDCVITANSGRSAADQVQAFLQERGLV